MATPARVAVKQVKPLLSTSHDDARRRALNLYKAWYRQTTFIVIEYDIPKSVAECRQKLREEYMKHANVKDLRVIDLLIIKGTMDLQEATARFKTNGSMMNYWKETENKKPKDFMSKFLAGQE